MIISPRRLRAKLLGDKYNAVIFEKGRDRGVYMVGGYVRDTLRGVPSQDRDFVISGNLTSFANGIRDIFGGTIVKLGKADMVRLALGGGVTFDFASPMGTMAQDLSMRDFTVNAIAWSPEREITDMHRGLQDLEKKRIRMISRNNLIADPLRLLRAYRFAAELGGSIEKGTLDAIKTLHDRLEMVSPERITLELFHLLNSVCSFRYLKRALDDGVLSDILSIPHKALENNVRAISKLEKRMLEEIPQGIKVLLYSLFSQNLTYKGLLCFELLVRGDLPPWERIMVSSSIVKRVRLAVRGLSRLENRESESEAGLFDIFVDSKDAAVDILIIGNRTDLMKEYRRFKRIMKRGLLDPPEIMEITGLRSGPAIGKSILALRKAEFGGAVKSREDAAAFIRKRFSPRRPEAKGSVS